MHAIDAICTVTLRDCPEDLPAHQRQAAEARYVEELGRTLGARERIGSALDAVAALEFSAAPITLDDLVLVRQWDHASLTARRVALQHVGGDAARHCYFDVQRLHF